MNMRLTLRSFWIAAVPMTLVVALSACHREDTTVRVQTVPKQPAIESQPSAAMAMQAQMPPGGAMPAAAGAAIGWTVPDGWKELPGDGLRFATIQVLPDHPEILLTVIPLSGESGGLLANINRWRDQVGLPAIAAADLAKNVTHFDIDQAHGDSATVVGPETAKPRLAILGAAIAYGGQTWFFKIAGPAELVTPLQNKFDAFVKTVKFGAGGANARPQPAAGNAAMPPLPAGHPEIPGAEAQPQMPAGHPAIPGVPAANAAEAAPLPFKFETPAGWIKDEPMPMRAVSFHIGEADKRVDVVVSQLAAIAGGGFLENVNRWRGQVGLQPIKQGDPQPSQPMKIAGSDATLFDFVGPGAPATAKRKIVAWVPRGNEWWFFAISGTDQQVSQQQANFNVFLKSLQFIVQ